MSDKQTVKRSAQILRRSRGGVADGIVQRNREHQRIRKELTRALQQGPGTVPQIAESTGLPTDEVFRHLMAMRKYGKVMEGEECGDYFTYALMKPEEGT